MNTTTERECGCPPWVEPCVHFDGQLLWLIDGVGAIRDHASTCNRFPDKEWPEASRYAVAVGPESEIGPCGACGEGTFIEVLFYSTNGGTLDEARAEFDHRAAQLVGGTA